MGNERRRNAFRVGEVELVGDEDGSKEPPHDNKRMLVLLLLHKPSFVYGVYAPTSTSEGKLGFCIFFISLFVL